jgi:hypothetical protein
MAVKGGADLIAVFHDCGLGANLHDTVFDYLNTVNNLNFF